MMHLSSEYERTHEVEKDWVHGHVYEKTITKGHVISRVLKLWPSTVNRFIFGSICKHTCLGLKTQQN